MKKLLSLITTDWMAKIVSLILAIAVWFLIKIALDKERSATIIAPDEAEQMADPD